MTKNILAAALVVALSACSSSSSDSDDGGVGTVGAGGAPETGGAPDTGGTPTTTPGEQPGTPIAAPVGGGAGPAADSLAGTYVGNFGDGAGEGVYVIDNDNQLAGLAVQADGSALSLFGSVGAEGTFNGALRQYIHNASEANPGVESFASVAGRADDLAITVGIINGQSITSTAESATAVSLVVATDGDSVQAATATTLAGAWTANNTFCELDGVTCTQLATNIVFSGLTVTGSTTVTPPGGPAFDPLPIVGGITEFGDAAIVEFNWNNTPGYRGVVYFSPTGDGTIVFIGELDDAIDETPATISAVLARSAQ